jgi:hypothetical protein
VVFGEIHGTAEIPAFVADACRSLASQGRVHVGLELPVSETPALQAFLASTDDRALQSTPTWSRTYQDGRTSEAVLGLLRNLREARKSGVPVEVFFFDDPERLGPERRDEAMAENIAAERGRSPSDIYVVEVGNWHAKTSPGAPWDPARRWMASYLAGGERGVLTLDVRGPTGTAWLCTSPKRETCGIAKVGTSAGKDKPTGTPARAVSLGSLDGYDGTYSVKGLTASPPAFEK